MDRDAGTPAFGVRGRDDPVIAAPDYLARDGGSGFISFETH